ncbi:MAG: CopG family ribbon-helix-helix protein [Bacteriovoracia bacterium]
MRCITLYIAIFLLVEEIIISKSAVSVRIDQEKIKCLDDLAAVNMRDRSFLINEAIDLYLDINNWQIERIKSSVKQAGNMNFASNAEVSKAIKKWQK